MKKYIFKTIKTPKGCYIYDRSYNRVFRVAENEFDEFLNVENGIMDADASAVIQKYSQDGVLGVNQLREIEHPETKLLAHYADCRLKQLTLQVTQQCNLRCAYCVYSGNYYTREHSDKKMPWETALKALFYHFKFQQWFPAIKRKTHFLRLCRMRNHIIQSFQSCWHIMRTAV